MSTLVRTELGVADLGALAAGCAVLGSGGGGDVRAAELLVHRVLERVGSVPLLDPCRLAEEQPDALVCFAGAVGSPTVLVERLPGESEFATSVRRLQECLGGPVAAVAPLEIGGINGLLGVVAPALLGLPVLDADAMGRAYPRLDLTVLAPHVPVSPAALAVAGGGTVVLDGLDAAALEQAVRGMLPALGTWAAVALYACTAAEAARHAVRGSISRALAIGGASTTPVCTGRVVEVARSTAGRGGVVTLELDAGEGWVRIDFADEHVLAIHDGRPIAAAPEVIALVDQRTGRPITVDDTRVGQHLGLRVEAPAPEVAAEGARLGLGAYGLRRWAG